MPPCQILRMPHPTLKTLLWDREDQGLQLKPTLEDRLYPNKSWWGSASTQSRTKNTLSSPSKKHISLLQRLSDHQPTKCLIKPSLLSQLHTSTCSTSGLESLRNPKSTLIDHLKIENPSLLERMNIESRVSSRVNLLENAPNLTSPALDMLKSCSEEVSSPQTSRVLTKSFLTGCKTLKKFDDNSCTTTAAQNFTKLAGQKSSLANVSTLTPYIPSSPPHALSTNALRPLEILRSSSPELQQLFRRRSQPLRSGLRPGTGPPEPSNLLSLIERMSSPPMGNISMINPTVDLSEPMSGLSDLTKLSGTGSLTRAESNCQTCSLHRHL
jgi:hypothetical protein